MSLLTKIFGTHSQHELKKIEPIVNSIEALADKYSSMSEEELKSQTDVLKSRLANGESLDDILPDAYAVVREAATRVLGERHYRVQLIGGIVVHQGRIAELKTGEGKTLMATLPAYLNALSGKGVHIVTVNDYLAKRDSEWMGKVYNFLGISVGLIVHGLTSDERRNSYNADITYGTNNEFGFDYLRDNMAVEKSDLVQRGHNFAIVDEVDSILIDEARTPLIISGRGEKSTELYSLADKFVAKLKGFRVKELDAKQDIDLQSDSDYIVDEKGKNVVLTSSGVKKAEEHFKVDNLSDAENTTLSHHINQALRARAIMQKDVDYIVKDNKVLIVDGFTGRIMPGRRYSNGLHQAIEAKERVEVQKENKTLATITFQNFFRLYSKLSGMTGTALTEEDEFREIYNLDVIEIPTNKPLARMDMPDAVYKTLNGKYNAICDRVEECHKNGQPVLLGTVSIDKSELISSMLKKRGIPHNVLNAKYHEKEAEIIAQAGTYGAVTIATNMAGRGTDIKLGGNNEFLAKNEMRKMGLTEEQISESMRFYATDDEEKLSLRRTYKELCDKYAAQIRPEAEKVREAGGLCIIGSERHESRRIDNQLRGRSGRQGDPGVSRFYMSLEDDLMRLFGSERVQGVVNALGLPEDQPIDAKILSGSIESAQKRLEGVHFQSRKNVLMYDDVMNQQRTIIYSQRREVLDGLDLREKILKMVDDCVKGHVYTCFVGDECEEWSFDSLVTMFPTLCRKEDFEFTTEELNSLDKDELADELISKAHALYEEKEKVFGADVFREIERSILLRNVDEKWMEHIDAMDEMKGGIGLRAYAQHNPLIEYKNEGGAMFDEMVAAICDDTVGMLLRIMPRPDGGEVARRVAVAKITGEGKAKERMNDAKAAGGDATLRKEPVRKTEKVGRNDPCPCGSGKKYKKCCGAGEGEE